MKKILILLVIVGGLFSCLDQDTFNGHDSNKAKNSNFTDYEKAILAKVFNDRHTMSVEDAQKRAEDAMAFLFTNNVANNTLKSATQPPKITNVQVIRKSQNLKSSQSDAGYDTILPDTIAYILNFGEDNGYALIAADDRIEQPVLACSDLGNVPDEIIEDETLGFILDNVGEYIVNQLETAEAKEDSIMDGIIDKLETALPNEYLEEDDNSDESDLKAFRIFRKKKKKYTVSVSNTPITGWNIIAPTEQHLLPIEWGQGVPYSNNVKNKKSCGTVVTGCVATAVAQIMAYWKYPAKIDNITFDWGKLTEKTYISNYASGDALARNQVAHLMERIGEGSNMNYGCKSSGTKTYKGRNYMRQVGYQGGSESKYNFNTVVGSLDAGSPVLAKGDRTFKYIKVFGKKIGYTKNGHAWVIDGYVKKRRLMKQVITTYDRKTGKVINQQTSTYYEVANFIHNNWGWNGSNNGWFAEGCFDSYNGQVSDPTIKSYSDDFDAGESGNYKYNNKIYTYIRPSHR